MISGLNRLGIVKSHSVIRRERIQPSVALIATFFLKETPRNVLTTVGCHDTAELAALPRFLLVFAGCQSAGVAEGASVPFVLFAAITSHVPRFQFTPANRLPAAGESLLRSSPGEIGNNMALKSQSRGLLRRSCGNQNSKTSLVDRLDCDYCSDLGQCRLSAPDIICCQRSGLRLSFR